MKECMKSRKSRQRNLFNDFKIQEASRTGNPEFQVLIPAEFSIILMRAAAFFIGVYLLIRIVQMSTTTQF